MANYTPEEIAEELERIKDPVYTYNKYWRKDGEPEMTQENWDDAILLAHFSLLKLRDTGRRIVNLSKEERVKLLKILKEEHDGI